jgi:hypothetical protein
MEPLGGGWGGGGGGGPPSPRGSGELVLDLPDLHAGATQIVLVECRGSSLAARFADPEVRVRLGFDPAAGGPREHRTARASIAVDPRHAAGDLRDPEVEKNHTIAVLAQAMHDMAVAAADSRWIEADRVLRRGLRLARQRFPSGDDPDLGRLVEMAERFREVLRGYVDRFRDA